MNALYDAPIDAQGRQIFEEIAPRDRGSLRLEQPAVLCSLRPMGHGSPSASVTALGR